MRIKMLISIFLALLLSLGVAVLAAAQEGPVSLYAVEPAHGLPGEELDLILRGEGFQRAEIIGVEIDGIEVREFWVDSNQIMGVNIFIPEFAEPGPRGVVIIASLGENETFTAFLEGGFFVLEREEAIPPSFDNPPEEPPDEIQEGSTEDDLPLLLILVLVLAGLGVGGGAALIIALNLRNAALRQSWQKQAQSQELPKNCHPSTYINRREDIEIKPGRWQVTGVQVTLYDSKTNRSGDTHDIPGDLVTKLDHSARHRLRHGETDELSAKILEIAREFQALILAWGAISKVGRDVYLQAKLEGGSAEAKFARYQCVGQPGRWQKVLEWSAKLKAVDHLPATFRASVKDESIQEYQVHLEGELLNYLEKLIEETARLL